MLVSAAFWTVQPCIVEEAVTYTRCLVCVNRMFRQHVHTKVQLQCVFHTIYNNLGLPNHECIFVFGLFSLCICIIDWLSVYY